MSKISELYYIKIYVRDNDVMIAKADTYLENLLKKVNFQGRCIINPPFRPAIYDCLVRIEGNKKEGYYLRITDCEVVKKLHGYTSTSRGVKRSYTRFKPSKKID